MTRNTLRPALPNHSVDGTRHTAPVTLDVCARGMAHDLWGESPLYTNQEEVLGKDKGVVVRRGLKEVRSKVPTRRTAQRACEQLASGTAAGNEVTGKPNTRRGGLMRMHVNPKSNSRSEVRYVNGAD